MHRGRSGAPSARSPPAFPEFGSASICPVLPRGRIAWRWCVRFTMRPRRSMRPGISFCKPGGFADRARNTRTSEPWRRGCSEPGGPLPPFVIIPGPIENTGVQVPSRSISRLAGCRVRTVSPRRRSGLARMGSPVHAGSGAAVSRPGSKPVGCTGRCACGRGQSISSAARRPPPSSLTKSATPYATPTGETRSARAACWRAGWSRRAFAWLP